MVYRILKIKLAAMILILAFSCLVYSAEKLNEASMDDLAGQAGISLVFGDFQVSQTQPHIAIGGEDGLGIPEAPDGAWFIMTSTRVMTLDLSDATLDIDCVSIGEDDANFSPALRDAVFEHEAAGVTTKPVAALDFGKTDFYSFSSDALITLKFGNNCQGDTNSDAGLFTNEIMQFQLDGSTMSVKSDDAAMYVFSHPDGNFEITPP